MHVSATLSYLLYAASVAMAVPTNIKRAGTGYSSGSTANDVKDGVCAPVTFIFARGSTEPGNLGASVGPAVAKALISDLGADGVAIQGVDYEATIASNALMGSGGGPVLKKLVDQAKQNCPDTKVAIGGYSQGGSVVHYAASKSGLSADDVSAVVLYGDPMQRQSVGNIPSSKVKEYCASGDGVCETGTFSISAAHLSYTSNGDAKDGAQFIEQNSSGGSGSSGSATSSGEGAATTSAASSSGSSGSSGLSGLGSFGNLGSFGSGSSGSSDSSTGSGFGSLFGGGRSGGRFGSIFGGSKN